MNNESILNSRNIDLTDHVSKDKGKTERTSYDKCHVNERRGSACQGVTPSGSCVNESWGVGVETLTDIMTRPRVSADSEADGVSPASFEGHCVSPSPAVRDCKFFLGTPAADNDIATLWGRRRFEVKDSMPSMTEDSLTDRECKPLRTTFSDVNCLTAAKDDTLSSSYKGGQASMYVSTAGCCSPPGRTRLLGSSTATDVTRVLEGSGTTDTSVFSFRSPEGLKSSSAARTYEVSASAMGGFHARGVQTGVVQTGRVHTGGVQAESTEDSDPLQCPKCLKCFRIEDHYLLMDHMEEICMK